VYRASPRPTDWPCSLPRRGGCSATLARAEGPASASGRRRCGRGV